MPGVAHTGRCPGHPGGRRPGDARVTPGAAHRAMPILGALHPFGCVFAHKQPHFRDEIQVLHPERVASGPFVELRECPGPADMTERHRGTGRAGRSRAWRRPNLEGVPPVPGTRHLLRAKDLADSRYFEALSVADMARARLGCQRLISAGSSARRSGSHPINTC